MMTMQVVCAAALHAQSTQPPKRGTGSGIYPVAERVVLPARRTVRMAELLVTAIPVMHSLLAPAVGYRISDGRTAVFYVPDVAHIPRLRETLRNIDVYVGDGATIEHPLLRRQGRLLVGHASIRQQVAWCQAARVRQAIFTHCGSAIVAAGAAAELRVRQLGTAAVHVSVAFDGWRHRIEREGHRARRLH